MSFAAVSKRYVEEVAAIHGEVIVHHRDVLGFRPPRSDEALPDNGGDGRFDVYLVDLAGNTRTRPGGASSLALGGFHSSHDLHGCTLPVRLTASDGHPLSSR